MGATDLTLGRAKRADVCMRDDTTVSEAHARLARSPGGSWTLRDVGSSNGTAVNGVRLARGGEAGMGGVGAGEALGWAACGLMPACAAGQHLRHHRAQAMPWSWLTTMS